MTESKFLIILISAIIIGSAIFILPSEQINIPPTRAYVKIITSNDTIRANNYTGIINFVGVNMTVTGNNQTQTVYFIGNVSNPSSSGSNDNKTNVKENSILISTIGRILNFVNINDFSLSNDILNDEIDITINRDAYGVAGLGSTGRLYKSIQNGTTAYTDQVNNFSTFDQKLSNCFYMRNPAFTFTTKICGGAVTANRTLNFPLITGTDTLPALNLPNIFTQNQFIQRDSAASQYVAKSHGQDATSISRIVLQRSEGTGASPTPILLNDVLGQVLYQGYTGSAYITSAFTRAYGTVNWTLTSTPTLMDFGTTPTGSTSPIVRMVIEPYGAINLVAIADPTSVNNDIWISTTNADVIKYQSGGTVYNILSTKGVVTTSTPADTNGTTNTANGHMLGYASAITPALSTRLDITVCGQLLNTVLNSGASVQLKYGTGTAPTNGAATTGTSLGAAQSANSLVAGQTSGFCVTGIATGLTINTAYWIDVNLKAITSGTAKITGATIKAHEI